MNYISLFSGAMGLDVGLEQVGLSCSLCVERDGPSISTIGLNKPKVQVISDISILGPPILSAHKGCFLVAGGPPCQAFSTSGRRKAFDDPRGVLLLEFGRVVNIVRPRFFVFENVKGLLSAKLNDGGSILEYVLGGYKDMGYKVIHGVLDAVSYGVPQFRERLIVMGSRDGEPIFLPKPTHFKQHQCHTCRWKTIRSVIEDLENDPGPCASFPDEKVEWLGKIPEGGNWKDLDEDDVISALKKRPKGGGNTGYLRRLSYSEPSPTLLTSPTQKSTLFCHPTKIRPLSVREYARIQQFPDNWLFYGTLAEQYRQIGNAVPIGLGNAIGMSLISTALCTSTIKTRRSARH